MFEGSTVRADVQGSALAVLVGACVCVLRSWWVHVCVCVLCVCPWRPRWVPVCVCLAPACVCVVRVYAQQNREWWSMRGVRVYGDPGARTQTLVHVSVSCVVVVVLVLFVLV